MLTVTVIVSVLVLSLSVAVSSTVHVFESVPEPHPGFSKSGALVNVRAPVAEFTVNNPWSCPPEIEYTIVVPASASVAPYVAIVVCSSFGVAVAVSPAENTGELSFVSTTVAVIVIVSVLPEPSETEIITTQTSSSLFAPQPWFSKSGALAKVRAPVAEFILNKSESTEFASVPESTIAYSRVSPESASVPV